ncbi:MAG: hypothetical protein HKN37_17295 [Rhodothermales bacterium]|nr:hypothetical protein [Rhodothermales bacterium]
MIKSLTATPTGLVEPVDARRSWWLVVSGFSIVAILLLVAAQGSWGFHRDEFLYLAMGRHVDWGYWSNPPLIGALGWVAENVTGSSLFVVRLFPLAALAGTLFLTAAMVRDLGGGTVATAIACLPFVVSPGLLRPASLFQPVMFDILMWTLLAWVVVRYLTTSDSRWLVGLGIVVGVGLLNKYSIIFFVIALFAAVAFSSHRRQLLSRHVLFAMILAALLVLPNLLWQISHGWPVLAHMRELSETQLVNVLRLDFLTGQLLIHLPVTLFWMGGLLWLFGKKGRRYRLLAVTFVFVVLLLLVLRGKSYYTLGAYPMLFAAAGVWLEAAHGAVRWSLALLALVLGVLASPFSTPYLPVDSMLSYGKSFVQRTGVNAPLVWETGILHDLPQDYADMLGWEELAELAIEAHAEAEDAVGTVIFAENYGQAGAIEYYGRGRGLPDVISFGDSYRLWAPDSLPQTISTLIYVSDDPGTVFDSLFGASRVVGRVENVHARERGTEVLLMTEPDSTARDFYARVAAQIKESFSRGD